MSSLGSHLSTLYEDLHTGGVCKPYVHIDTTDTILGYNKDLLLKPNTCRNSSTSMSMPYLSEL